MNTTKSHARTLIAVAVTAALFAACATPPTKPDGVDALRSRLMQLQANPDLANRAPLAMKEADLAVNAAEQPQSDEALAAHLMFMADRKISIAEARAEGRLLVDQRDALGKQREAMRLQVRTDEADAANRRSALTTANAQRDVREMQRQIDELQAKTTDRGLVLTLGDVLFASGTAELNVGGSANLGRLATFLTTYPERTILIEGYTDSVGSEDYNQGLSQRRADAVKSYLLGQNIAASRMVSSGKGESSPIGDNGSNTGRQQNRRVEVIIESKLVSAN